MKKYQYILPFKQITAADVALVGGKNASLGEMVTELGNQGVCVPDGFATTAEAYRLYLEHNGLTSMLEDTLSSLNIEDIDALKQAGQNIRDQIIQGELPLVLVEEITQAYQDLAGLDESALRVAVRSSATAEDLPTASFAGQQETYLNIHGKAQLLDTCKRVFASLFTDRAIAYRVHQGFDHMTVALSIGVQKMVRSDLGASGVMFTLDSESGFRDVVMVTSSYGLGETVVQGSVNPDEFMVFKPTLMSGHAPVLRRRLGEKAIKMIYQSPTEKGAAQTLTTAVEESERERFSITDEEVLELARIAVIIEKHYSNKAGSPCPMDIEWAKDGGSGKLYILQARPETVHSQTSRAQQESWKLKQQGKVLCQGKSVGHKIGAGTVRVIGTAAEMQQLKAGEVLVTDMTDPDWEPVLKTASAIVTNRGGRVCHAAIIARELGIPAIVGCGNATELLKTGQLVTASCAEGETGNVYQDILDYEKQVVDIANLPCPKTKIMLIAGNPGQAFQFAALPNDGVGLARMEFIISNAIGIHPQALLEFDRLSAPIQKEIRQRIKGYSSPAQFYVDRLAEGIASIAAAFYPKPVILRTSDFKSNEYASLLGGENYEPEEENPMLGLRGASRYYAESFQQCFVLECEAIKQVREKMGLVNLEVMLPFVRTVEEVIKVSAIMAENGLVRGENGLKLNLMCEIPANALLAQQFLEHCDGFSIGSNDLTQLTLGVDRDSELLSQFDERNDALKVLMAMAIKACVAEGKYIGICGQGPSDYPEITQWLIAQGIESIALNPDSIIDMTRIAYEAEQDLAD